VALAAGQQQELQATPKRPQRLPLRIPIHDFFENAGSSRIDLH